MPGALRYVRGGRPPPQTLKSECRVDTKVEIPTSITSKRSPKIGEDHHEAFDAQHHACDPASVRCRRCPDAILVAAGRQRALSVQMGRRRRAWRRQPHETADCP